MDNKDKLFPAIARQVVTLFAFQPAGQVLLHPKQIQNVSTAICPVLASDNTPSRPYCRAAIANVKAIRPNNAPNISA